MTAVLDLRCDLANASSFALASALNLNVNAGNLSSLAIVFWYLCGIFMIPQRYEDKMGLIKKSIEERFWSKVDKSGSCWLWQANTNNKGYGLFGMPPISAGQPNRTVSAHRLSYQFAYGDIPAEMFICHRCDNPRCVNPLHLFLGTNQDNVSDMVAKGRHHNQVVTHCPAGHEYTADNSFVSKKGKRNCKECNKKAALAYYHRKKLKKP